MKLEEHNVKKAIMACLVSGPVGGTVTERRDGCPVIEIEGVRCAVDTTGEVVQTGEGREQRWFRVVLHDVTPRKFLSREAQEAMQAEEVEDWWLVTTPTRTAFVHAQSRSQALQDFSAKYPNEADGADCELARGFDFVDSKLPAKDAEEG